MMLLQTHISTQYYNQNRKSSTFSGVDTKNIWKEWRKNFKENQKKNNNNSNEIEWKSFVFAWSSLLFMNYHKFSYIIFQSLLLLLLLYGTIVSFDIVSYWHFTVANINFLSRVYCVRQVPAVCCCRSLLLFDSLDLISSRIIDVWFNRFLLPIFICLFAFMRVQLKTSKTNKSDIYLIGKMLYASIIKNGSQKDRQSWKK